MNKLLIAILSLTVLTACDPITREQRDRANAIRQEQADKTDHQMVQVLSKDGCKVYRFYDMGHYRYFANCTGSVTIRQSSGKSTYPEDISTN